MNNSTALRTLATFGILVPIAIFLGYMLADPLQYSTFATIGFIFAVLAFPILMRWHQPLLLLVWNISMVLPFVKGQPPLWLLVSALALGIAIFERCLNREMRFVQAWSITMPLLFLVAVVLMTAKLTGGMGLRAFGSDVYGGKKYIILLGAVAAYFALTAWRIPADKATTYVALFFAGGLVSFVSDLYGMLPSGLNFLFWFFPPSTYISMAEHSGILRLAGVSTAGQTLFILLVARYGLTGIFRSGKLWRPAVLFAALALSLLGGFRSILLTLILLVSWQFFLEGLHKTRLFGMIIGVFILGSVLMIPLASKLPFSVQRTLAFLPLELDSTARLDAEGSSQWRLEMWAALWPQVPNYLLLGKGYAISQQDHQMMGYDVSFKAFDAGQQGLALAGDYHNGPLSILLPFGIWGAIAFIWFVWAALRLLYRNFRHGSSELKIVNGFLLACFLTRLIIFTFVFGALSADMWQFVGFVGMSVALNNGMAAKPVTAPEITTPSLAQKRLITPRPAFQR